MGEPVSEVSAALTGTYLCIDCGLGRSDPER